MATEVQLPVSRIVWGNPAKSQKKTDQKTRQVILKDGKPIEVWGWGQAIPEAEFVAKVWPAMETEAKTLFPQGFPPQFSWKYKSGITAHNAVDRSGKRYDQREGYAGCYVLNINTEAFAPPIYKWQNGMYVQMQPNEIKCGDYVITTVRFQANKPENNTHTPGLYVNPVAVLWVAYGNEIVNGPDPTALFGQQQPQFQLPPGASLTPIGPNTSAGMPGTGGPGSGQMQPGGPQPGPGQYQPPNDPRFTGGGPQPNQMQPNPGQYQPNQMQSNQMQPNPGQYQPNPGQYQPNPGQYQPNQMQPNPGQYQPNPGQVQPAHDFVQNAGQQQQPGPGQYQPNSGGPYPNR